MGSLAWKRTTRSRSATDTRQRRSCPNLRTRRSSRTLSCTASSLGREYIPARISQLHGILIISRSDEFKGKKVVVVRLSATASDMVAELLPAASKLYLSYRRGAIIVPRWQTGFPPDLMSSWRRRKLAGAIQSTFPNVTRWLLDRVLALMMKRMWGKLDPAWGLMPPPSFALAPRASSEHVLVALREGSLALLPGIKRFVGSNSIEFADGTVLDDVDAVVCATGYRADFTVTPFLEKSRPPNYGGSEIVRLWMNLFPPKYADSIVMLYYSALRKNNGFSFSDVTSMAVSNMRRGVHLIPTITSLERQVDKHQEWVISRWRLEHNVDISMVKQWEYRSFLYEAAGTVMDNLGWGWEGWKFWFKDPKMSYMMNNRVETAYAFRFFETGKRKAWPGARDAIIHMNELVKMFPLKEGDKQP